VIAFARRLVAVGFEGQRESLRVHETGEIPAQRLPAIKLPRGDFQPDGRDPRQHGGGAREHESFCALDVHLDEVDPVEPALRAETVERLRADRDRLLELDPAVHRTGLRRRQERARLVPVVPLFAGEEVGRPAGGDVKGRVARAVRQRERDQFGIGDRIAGEVGADQHLVRRQRLEGKHAGAREPARKAHGVLAFAGADVADDKRGVRPEEPAEFPLGVAGLREIGGEVDGLKGFGHADKGSAGSAGVGTEVAPGIGARLLHRPLDRALGRAGPPAAADGDESLEAGLTV